ncbi:MAG: glycine oxidase ThiO [Pyrinomonadaceae bacterium]
MKVVVIGGGIAGLCVARELKRAGLSRISIIDDSGISGAATDAAAGMLTPQAETDKDDAFFRFSIKSRDFYDQFVSELEEETGFDTRFDDTGTLVVAFSEADESVLRERYNWQKSLGLDVEYLNAQETHQRESFINPASTASLFFPRDCQIDNVRLHEALGIFAERNDIAFLNGRAVSVDASTAATAKVALENGSLIESDVVVIAGGAWTSSIVSQTGHPLLAGIHPVKGQMLSFRTVKRFFDHVLHSPRGYVVPRADGRIVVGATVEKAGYDCEITDRELDGVRRSAVEMVPSFRNLSIEKKWVGLRPGTEDGLPLLGKLAGHNSRIYAAAGYYRNGILIAPYAGMLLAREIIEGKSEMFPTEFAADRFSK